MKKLLIGISAPDNNTAREAIGLIAEEFDLEHISMQQPVINMLSTLTESHPSAFEYCITQSHMVTGLNVTVAESATTLAFCLRTINPAFFIERTKEAREKSRKGLNIELFSGDIISGIKSEAEAQWIRDQGGLMLHLYHYDDICKFHAMDEMDGDLVAVIDAATPNKQHLAGTFAAIDARINQNKKAA